jgi:hypothetical protein
MQPVFAPFLPRIQTALPEIRSYPTPMHGFVYAEKGFVVTSIPSLTPTTGDLGPSGRALADLSPIGRRCLQTSVSQPPVDTGSTSETEVYHGVAASLCPVRDDNWSL